MNAQPHSFARGAALMLASNTFFGSNVEEAVNYDIQSGDTVIYGVNKIRSSHAEHPVKVRWRPWRPYWASGSGKGSRFRPGEP